MRRDEISAKKWKIFLGAYRDESNRSRSVGE